MKIPPAMKQGLRKSLYRLLLEVKLPNSHGMSVGRSVCYSILKRWVVSLPYSYRVTCFRMGGNQVDDPEIPDTGTRSFKIIARLKVQRKLSDLIALTKDWAKIFETP